jgi:hypothetical protein
MKNDWRDLNIPQIGIVANSEFKRKIASAVMESISYFLGKNGANMVFLYSGVKQTDLSANDLDGIYDRLDELVPCLRQIFGPGSQIIEEQISPILKAAKAYSTEMNDRTVTASVDRKN